MKEAFIKTIMLCVHEILATRNWQLGRVDTNGDSCYLMFHGTYDAPEGRKLLGAMKGKVKAMKERRKASGEKRPRIPLLMDKAYEGKETRAMARKVGLKPGTIFSSSPVLHTPWHDMNFLERGPLSIPPRPWF